MAQGSIIWRCRVCGNKSAGSCKHPRAGYSIVFRVGRQQKWESVGRQKKVAERRLNEVVAQLHGGTYRSLRSTPFVEFAHRWLTECAVPSVKPSTLRSYRAVVRNHLLPILGPLPLTQITPETCQRLIAHLMRQGKSAKTANNALVLLKTMLKHARRWGLVRENAAQDIQPPRIESKEMDALTPADVRLLLRNADEPYRTLFLTAALTGMRRGELLGLQWGDVDWASHLIYVRRSLYWRTTQEMAGERSAATRWHFISPKSTRSVRGVVISPGLREALELHRLACPISPHDLVFCNHDGNPLDPDNMVKREFLPALVRAGLRRIRFHDLRHTYTTLLIAQGEHVKFIQSQLGHASVQTTLDRYGHLLPTMAHGVGQRLDAQVFGHPIRANTVLTNHAETGQNTADHQADRLPITLTHINH